MTFVYAYPRPHSGAATAGIVLGLLSLLLPIPFLVSLAAIGAGHAGMRDTRDGYRSGHGAALAGALLGYLTLACWSVAGLWVALLVMAGVSSG